MALREIYLGALDACRPDVLVRDALTGREPRNVVALGKCAGAMVDGAAMVIPDANVIAAIPEGYPLPGRDARVLIGGHPEMTPASFTAGRALTGFVERYDDILFLISGGGSACAETVLAPFDENLIRSVNHELLRSGLPIEDINVVRRHMSAMKGGRLASFVRGRSETLIYSDVTPGAPADVASGPTVVDTSTIGDAVRILGSLPDPSCSEARRILQSGRATETPRTLERSGHRVVADNETLTSAAARIAAGAGFQVLRMEQQLEGDVGKAAEALALAARSMRSGDLLVAGGETTVSVRGAGTGGRCSELALRFARHAGDLRLRFLFAGSDGVDGNSGAAGIEMSLPATLDRNRIETALTRSDSFPIAAALGEAIMIRPTGNNLRDLFLLACT